MSILTLWSCTIWKSLSWYADMKWTNISPRKNTLKHCSIKERETGRFSGKAMPYGVIKQFITIRLHNIMSEKYTYIVINMSQYRRNLSSGYIMHFLGLKPSYFLHEKIRPSISVIDIKSLNFSSLFDFFNNKLLLSSCNFSGISSSRFRRALD